MKYSIAAGCLLLVACVAAAVVVMAAEEGVAELRASRLVQSMDLQGDEAEDVAAVLTTGFARQSAIVQGHAGADDPGSRRAMAEQIRESQQQTRALLEPLLTAEQLAALDEAMEQQRNRASGERAVQQLGEPLGLTPDQQEQLVPIFAEFNAKRGELMEEFRGGGVAMRGMREKMQKLDGELEEQLKPILGKEQLEAFNELRDERRAEMRSRRRGGGSRF